MTAVAWAFALLAAAIHLVVFLWEAVLLDRPRVHQGIFGIAASDLPAVRLWAVNVGFYNLFLACGMIFGVVAWMTGHDTVGQTLVVYLCLFMVLGGVSLFVSDRLALSRPRGSGVSGAVAEAVPPLIALVATAF